MKTIQCLTVHLQIDEGDSRMMYKKPFNPLVKLDIQFFAEKTELNIKSLHTEFKEAWGELKGLLDDQSEEIKKYGTTNDDTVNKIKSVEGKISEIGDEMKEIQKRADEIEKKFGRPDLAGGGQVKSLGEMFVQSEAFEAMKKANEFKSAPMRTKSLYQGSKAIITTDTGSGGALTGTQTAQVDMAAPTRAFRLRDLLPVQATQSNAIEYVQETGFTNTARPVAETTAKPESALTFDVMSESVKTIAHWIPASRQVLDDAGQLQAYINNRLLYGLMLAEEQQILYGDGTSPNLQGILTHTGIQGYNWSGGTVGDSKIDAIRRAITLARIAEYPVNGVVLHPNDWEDIQLAKGDDGHYIWVNVNDGGVMRLWSVPVVETTAIAEGEALIGSFNMGAMLWDREDANIRVGEPQDYFTRNMVAILAEERMALTIFRPEAFVGVTFDAAPTAGV